MKGRYDGKTTEQKFEMADEVLILLPTNNHPLKAKFQGPFKIRRKIRELNYIMDTPDRKKEDTKMSHKHD